MFFEIFAIPIPAFLNMWATHGCCNFFNNIRGRCYDHTFLRFLPIFGEKIGVFLKNQCYDQNFAYFSFVSRQKRQFFLLNFLAKIFKNHNIGPWYVWSITYVCTRYVHTEVWIQIEMMRLERSRGYGSWVQVPPGCGAVSKKLY
jgi:hypothetical protein